MASADTLDAALQRTSRAFHDLADALHLELRRAALRITAGFRRSTTFTREDAGR